MEAIDQDIAFLLNASGEAFSCLLSVMHDENVLAKAVALPTGHFKIIRVGPS